MAKGNDGNYLQHCVEVEAAVLLAQTGPNPRLHVALTHGMEPFEKFENLKSNVRKELLCNALVQAAGDPNCDEREIVKAYRCSRASQLNYPNTAELLRRVIGTDGLSGGITEVCEAKCKKLSDAWTGTEIEVAHSSWRKQLPDGVLSCPDSLDGPWLFSMDPNSYTENGANNGENLHSSDLCLLACALERYVRSGQPGIASLFVYGVRKNERRKFWAFMDKLAERLDVPTYSYWVPHLGGNRNLVGLLFSDKELALGFVPPLIKPGRGKAN